MTDCVFRTRDPTDGLETEFNKKLGYKLQSWWKGWLYEIVVNREQLESGLYDKWLEELKAEFAVPEGLRVTYWDEIKMPKAIHTPMICHDYHEIELREMKRHKCYGYEDVLKERNRFPNRVKRFFKYIACKIVRLFS